MLISGNKDYGLAQQLSLMYPHAQLCSRSTGYDLCDLEQQQQFAELAREHQQIIICSALWHFEQTVLLDTVYKACKNHNKLAHIVCIGSTIDKTNKGGDWLYSAEKKALRDYTNSLGLRGIWWEGPKISYISFGTLSNNQHKHPDRRTLDIAKAAEYVQWVLDAPRELVINELSIDPMQPKEGYES